MRVSGAELAYKALREQIISGALKPGARITEPELAADLGLSRTPIREALRRLEAESLVQALNNGGTIVAPLDADSVKHIGLLRSRIESLLARQATLLITDDELSELERIVNLGHRLVDDDEEVLRLGKEFHQIINRASGNAWGQEMLRQIIGHVDRMRSLSTANPGRSEVAVAEHDRIFRALLQRDPELVEQEVRSHIERGLDSAETSLSSG